MSIGVGEMFNEDEVLRLTRRMVILATDIKTPQMQSRSTPSLRRKLQITATLQPIFSS